MATDNDGFLDPTATPGANAAILAAISSDEAPEEPRPHIPAPPDGYVSLHVGHVVNGKKVSEVEVRELNGEDEEKIAKARTSSDPTRFYNTILEQGVELDEDSLSALLVGDREELLLGVRKATYGPQIDVLEPVYCPTCAEVFEAVVNVDDIPRRSLKGSTEFDVPLRKGGKARVRLPNGSDQAAAVREPGLTDSERNTIMLQRCVITLPEDGEDQPVSVWPTLVLSLGIVDRRKILREINSRQPGPRYDEVVIEHECGTKIPVDFGMGALFPGL